MRLLMNEPLRISGIVTVLLVHVFSFSCSGSDANFKFETASPDGRYKVKLEGHGEPSQAEDGEFQRQIVTLQTTRDAQVVAADEKFFREDNLDVYFLDRYPVHEWVNNSTLRFGDAADKDRFNDRLVVTNRTNTPFDLVIVKYGKYEMFFIYDLAPGKQVELNASPQIYRETPAWNVHYRAFANGLPITGNVNGPERTKDSSTPLNLTVDIANDNR